MTFRTVFAALAVALVLPLAGCDETSQNIGLADEATVITDAQIARQNGDYAQATALLEGALELNPTSAPVRVELATTVLESRDLNLLDLDRLAQFLIDGRVGASRATAARADATAEPCPYASDGTSRQFNPRVDYGSEFPVVEASRADIDRVRALVEPVLPRSLKRFSIDSSIDAAGRLTYNPVTAADSLRATGLSTPQISQLLAANALARFFGAYLNVTETAQTVTWYRLPGNKIGVCADNLAVLKTQTKESVELLGTAVLSLDVRTKAFDGRTDLVTLALDAFKEIRAAFQGPPRV